MRVLEDIEIFWYTLAMESNGIIKMSGKRELQERRERERERERCRQRFIILICK